jgi:ElaB/YqjD/DUF883 family membrane-anchored ribosome-binding protein
MATTETARLEREAEQTRAQLEQTLGELRARMSPGQLFDQATDYFRNNSGRQYLHHLRDEVVHNPVPVALIGAGIAWLAISGTIGRRHNGGGRYGYDPARDWGRTAATADDLEHGGRGPSHGPSMAQRVRQAAEGLVDEARDAMSSARDGAEGTSERASTAYDEAIGQARETAEGWSESARSAAHQAGDTLREGVEGARERAGHMRDRASEMYEHTAGGVRRMAHRAAAYGRAARHSFDRDGALVTFCREQPLLVAGLGIAVGAALGAMIPSSRPERQVMGGAARDVQDRVRAAASETLRAAVGDPGQSQDRPGDAWQRESRQGEAARSDSTLAAESTRREGWQGETYREAATDLERGMQQSDRASNIETEPRRAPYVEASEAGAMGTPAPDEEQKQRT